MTVEDILDDFSLALALDWEKNKAKPETKNLEWLQEQYKSHIKVAAAQINKLIQERERLTLEKAIKKAAQYNNSSFDETTVTYIVAGLKDLKRELSKEKK